MDWIGILGIGANESNKVTSVTALAYDAETDEWITHDFWLSERVEDVTDDMEPVGVMQMGPIPETPIQVLYAEAPTTELPAWTIALRESEDVGAIA